MISQGKIDFSIEFHFISNEFVFPINCIANYVKNPITDFISLVVVNVNIFFDITAKLLYHDNSRNLYRFLIN